MSKFRKAVVTAVALVCTITLVGEPAGATGSDEDAFVARINSVRAAHGLAALAVDPRLSDLARGWSAHMAASGGIVHNGNLPGQAPREWTRLGENVGVGQTVDTLHVAFLNSPTHLRQIVDPGFRYVGVGVVMVNGEMWVTQHFMTTASGASAPAAKGRCAKKKCGRAKARAKAGARRR